MENVNNIYIRNDSIDLMSSMLLNDLIHVLGTRYRIADENIRRESTSITNTKCELTIAVSVLTSIATGIISAAIWDCIKGVYARRDKKFIDKEWKLSVIIDRPLHVVVKRNPDSDNIDVEIAEQ